MSAYRVEYLRLPGQDIKVSRVGFNTVEKAEQWARVTVPFAVLAHVIKDERIVKRLWDKKVCMEYESEHSYKRCWKAFDTESELAKHKRSHYPWLR